MWRDVADLQVVDIGVVALGLAGRCCQAVGPLLRRMLWNVTRLFVHLGRSLGLLSLGGLSLGHT